MASPAEIVRAFLIQQGLVVMPMLPGQLVPFVQTVKEDGVPCFVSSMPADPDEVVAIFDTAGIMFGRQQRGKRMQHLGIKVLIRYRDFGQGFNYANRVATGIDKIANTSILVQPENLSYAVQTVYLTSPILSLGEEVGNKRQLWSINARVAMKDTEPSLG